MWVLVGVLILALAAGGYFAIPAVRSWMAASGAPPTEGGGGATATPGLPSPGGGAQAPGGGVPSPTSGASRPPSDMAANVKTFAVTFGGTGNDGFNCAQQIRDGGFIAAGFTDSSMPA